MRRVVDSAIVAVAFLTVVPVRVRGGAPDLGAAAPWFPVVGAAVGAVAGGVRAGLDPLVGAGAASVLAVVALVILTGALHQDGLADCADALGARGGRERRLAVMRDSATGVFGTLALIGWALLTVAAVASLDPGDAVLALVAACAAGRWAAVLHGVIAEPARPGGLGAGFRVSGSSALLATAAACAVVLVALPWDAAVAALAAAALLAAALSASARRALGGRTGDTLGACVALAEVLALLVVVGFQGPA